MRARHRNTGGSCKLQGELGAPRKRGGSIHPKHLHGEGSEAKARADRRARGGSKNWIAGAIKHPGGLHKALHVPAGQKIPAKKMAKAAKSENPHVRQMVGLAKTLKKMH